MEAETVRIRSEGEGGREVYHLEEPRSKDGRCQGLGKNASVLKKMPKKKPVFVI